MIKHYLDYNTVHQLVAKTAEAILASGFEPDILVAIGGGGYIPARILRTFIYKPILTVSLSYYYDGQQKMTNQQPHTIQWLDDPDSQIAGRRILLVDEVDDTRSTLAYCSQELLRYHPEEIALCVLHQKRKAKLAQLPAAIQRIYVGAQLADNWICYPWDAHDIVQHNTLTAAAHPS